MSKYSTSHQTEPLPTEITEHQSPPNDRPGLTAWLRLRAEHHALLAEQRPWAKDFHRRMAESALECATFYEKREARK